MTDRIEEAAGKNKMCPACRPEGQRRRIAADRGSGGVGPGQQDSRVHGANEYLPERLYHVLRKDEGHWIGNLVTTTHHRRRLGNAHHNNSKLARLWGRAKTGAPTDGLSPNIRRRPEKDQDRPPRRRAAGTGETGTVHRTRGDGQ